MVKTAIVIATRIIRQNLLAVNGRHIVLTKLQHMAMQSRRKSTSKAEVTKLMLCFMDYLSSQGDPAGQKK